MTCFFYSINLKFCFASLPLPLLTFKIYYLGCLFINTLPGGKLLSMLHLETGVFPGPSFIPPGHAWTSADPLIMGRQAITLSLSIWTVFSLATRLPSGFNFSFQLECLLQKSQTGDLHFSPLRDQF